MVRAIDSSNGISIAFFRLGKDTTWTYIADREFMVDVLFVDHKILGPIFFFVENLGTLYSSNGESSTDSPCYVAEGDDSIPYTLLRYLADSNGGDPLMIERTVEYDEHTYKKRTTTGFKVFEVNHLEAKWTEKNTLGDDTTIFLGDNTAISVTASKFSGCEPNCIYFVRDIDYVPCDNHQPDGPGDYGVFNIESKSFSQGPYSTAVQALLKKTKLCPFWVGGFTPLQLKLC